jgi:ribosomal protein L23
MALFSKTKKTEKKADAVVATGGAASVTGDLSHVLKHARITEKATMNLQRNIYVFDIAENVSKQQVAGAIKKIYNVTPKMIRVAVIPSKTKRNARTGKVGIKKGGKKAYVYLKKEDSINL